MFSSSATPRSSRRLQQKRAAAQQTPSVKKTLTGFGSTSSPLTTPNVNQSFSASPKVAGKGTPSSSVAPTATKSQTAGVQPQTQILVETKRHRVETVSKYPNAVYSLFDRVDDIESLQGGIHSGSGYAWVIYGRKLYLWKCSLDVKELECKELVLPPQRRLHEESRTNISIFRKPLHDGLVCIVPPENEGGSYGIIAVSLGGFVYYWPNIAYDSCQDIDIGISPSVYVVSITEYSPRDYVVLSSKGELILIHLAHNGIGQSILTKSSLHKPQSVLHGLGQKMTTIFGLASAAEESPSVPISACHVVDASDTRSLFVLSERMLQKWCVSNGTGNLVSECDIFTLVADKLCEEEGVSGDDVAVWLLDVCAAGDKIAVLAASSPETADENYLPSVKYTIFVLYPEDSLSNDSIFSVVNVGYEPDYTQLEERKLLSLGLLKVETTEAAFVYGPEIIIQTSLPYDDRELDVIKFTDEFQTIIGATVNSHCAILMSPKLGVISVRQADINKALQPVVRTFAHRTASSVSAQDKKEIFDKLLSAFNFFLMGDTMSCQSRTEAFCGDVNSESEMDSAIVGASSEIVNSAPSSDPRWAEDSSKMRGRSSGTLILRHQMEEKARKHEAFIKYLSEIGLLDRCSPRCRISLGEHSEKLASIIAFRSYQNGVEQQGNAYASLLIESAIKETLFHRHITADSCKSSGAAYQDFYFRDVSRCDEILKSIQEAEQGLLAEAVEVEKRFLIVKAVNQVFEVFLMTAREHRRAISGWLLDHENARNEMFRPWTSSKQIRNLCLYQAKNVTVKLMDEIKDGEMRGVLYQQAYNLADVLLSGYWDEIGIISNGAFTGNSSLREFKNEFSVNRYALIEPFYRHGEVQRAFALAERYEDFSILVKLCDEANDDAKLISYFNRYEEQGFGEFLFEWYLNNGMKSKLMTLDSRYDECLSKFLKNHPELLWLHEIKINAYGRCQNTLLSLAKSEKKSLRRQKVLLSLSKLSALASESDGVGDNGLNCSSDMLSVIRAQEMMPSAALDEKVELKNIPLDPSNIIDLYTNERFEGSNSGHFLVALDVFMCSQASRSTQDNDKLLLLIWTRIIKKDSWIEFSQLHAQGTNDTEFEKKLVNTVFYKVISDLRQRDLHKFIPSVEGIARGLPQGYAEHNIEALLNTALSV
eukprot:Nk52_evm41s164 gene=Nk52_evmTU41s164